jgi:DNA gyrase subunit A
MKEDDGIEHFLTCCDHDDVLFFSDRGVVYSLKAYQIPASSRTARGIPIVQMLPIPRDEKITSVLSVTAFTDTDYLVMLTQKGFIKKTALSAFSNIRSNGLKAIALEEGDQLRWVRLAHEDDSIIVGSGSGMAIHFQASHKQLRPLGRATRGVKSMNLPAQDRLVGMDIISHATLVQAGVTEEGDLEEEVTTVVESAGPWVLTITTSGYGKRVPVSQFRLQNRAGKGTIATKFKGRQKGDKLAALCVVNEDDELMLVTSRGIVIRQSVSAISQQSRAATGVRVQRLDKDDAIAEVAIVPPVGEESLSEGTEEDTESVAEE